MTHSLHRRHLSVVPAPPVECWDSFETRAGSGNETVVDAYLRRQFGKSVVTLTCRHLFIIEDSDRRHPTAVDYDRGSLAVMYMGVEQVIKTRLAAPHDPRVRLNLPDVYPTPIAMFSTAIGPLAGALTHEQYEMMMENDQASLASCFEKVGVALDEEVFIGRLGDRETDNDQDVPPLCVVQ